MLEYFREDMRGFLWDDSRRPFLLYWLAMAIVIVDIAAHYKWEALFGPHISGVGVAPRAAGRFVMFLRPEAQVVVSAIFVALMLKWAELGILFAVFYLLFMKGLLYASLVGLYIGTEIIDRGVEIPSYLLLWEAAAVLALIIYIVRKGAVMRAAKRSVYAVTSFANGDSPFGPVTGEHLTTDVGPGPFDMELPRQPGIYRRHESVVVEGTPGRKNVRREYKIEDSPDGRVFVVRDSSTGEAMNYRSLDEMPTSHREAFARMLKIGGQMKMEADAEGVGSPGFSKRVERQWKYRIQDGPEGRRFTVSDPKTGASKTYRSLDEMPTAHREAFVRTLKSAGLWRGDDWQ